MSKRKERLQKILSASGVASRREAERMIAQGRVCVNGVQATLGQSAELNTDSIVIDGIPLAVRDKKVYLMLNKPRGYITTKSDERGRKTVMSLISGAGTGVYPVGRLDMDSEGLLLFTNDGVFANNIMHPSFGKLKTYVARVHGDAGEAAHLLQMPMDIDGYIVKAKKVALSSVFSGGGVLCITIAEGRNRQIRKMCAASGVKVRSLKRVSIGSLSLGNLKTGQWRFLTGEEVEALG